MNNKLHTAIEVAENCFPQLRIGQLILNAIPEDKLYYISDEDFIRALWAYIKEHGK